MTALEWCVLMNYDKKLTQKKLRNKWKKLIDAMQNNTSLHVSHS